MLAEEPCPGDRRMGLFSFPAFSHFPATPRAAGEMSDSSSGQLDNPQELSQSLRLPAGCRSHFHKHLGRSFSTVNKRCVQVTPEWG